MWYKFNLHCNNNASSLQIMVLREKAPLYFIFFNLETQIAGSDGQRTFDPQKDYSHGPSRFINSLENHFYVTLTLNLIIK